MSISIQESVDRFLEQNAARWSPETHRTYRTGLNRFVRYLAEVERVPATSPTLLVAKDPELLTRYADYLANDAAPAPESDAGLSELTYRLYLTSLLGWYAHLFETEALGGVSATDFKRMLMRLSSRRTASLKETALRPKAKRHAPPPELSEWLLRIAREDGPDPESSERDQQLGELRRLRNLALLHALMSTGARISEATGLNFSDLLDDRSATIRKDVAKGGKERVVFFKRAAWHALQVYLTQSGARRGEDPLFLRHDRGAGQALKRLGTAGAQAELRRLRSLLVRDLQEELIRLLVKDVTEEQLDRLIAAFDDLPKAGDLPDELHQMLRQRPAVIEQVDALRLNLRQAARITAHSFRHAVGSTLLETTGDLAAVQDILGHANPATTRDYAELSNRHLRDVHRRVFD